MTPVNGGADFDLRRYSANSDAWMDTPLPMVSSLVDAENSYGPDLQDGVKCILASEDDTSSTSYQYIKSDVGFSITSGEVSSISASSMVIKYVADGALKTITIDATENETLQELVDSMNDTFADQNAKGLSAEVDGSTLKIVASDISVLSISDKADTASLADTLGIEKGDHYPEASSSWKIYKNIVVSATEPDAPAEDGTLWFNDDLKVDIMVNSKGVEWVGFEEYYKDQEEKPGIFVLSEEPETAAEFSIWVNPAEEDYPVIRRKIAD